MKGGDKRALAIDYGRLARKSPVAGAEREGPRDGAGEYVPPVSTQRDGLEHAGLAEQAGGPPLRQLGQLATRVVLEEGLVVIVPKEKRIRGSRGGLRASTPHDGAGGHWVARRLGTAIGGHGKRDEASCYVVGRLRERKVALNEGAVTASATP